MNIPLQNFFSFCFLISEYTEKNFPNTLPFSTSLVAVTGFPLESTVFSSPILEFVFHHLLMYFSDEHQHQHCTTQHDIAQLVNLELVPLRTGRTSNFLDLDVDVDGVDERRPKPLCPHLEITLQ